MTIEDRWASSRGARIHFLDGAGDAGGPLVPIAFVPGVLEAAEDFRTEMAALAPRRCISISLRGRGKSDAPEVGYAFEDQVADVEAAVREAGLAAFCLMAYSVGVPIAIGYAERHPQSLAGLIIGDYPAHYPAIPPDWPERVVAAVPPDRARLEVARALQRESKEVLLWGVLPRIVCPTLVLRGSRPDSLLKEDDAARYRQYLPGVEVVVFDDVGHEFRKPDSERYLRTIRQFLEKLDIGRGV